MPFKNFVAGQVLGESDIDDYLMEQAVMTFASAAARNSALTETEGMVAYLEDSNTLTAYDGTSWWTVGRATAATTGPTLIVTQAGSVAVTNSVAEYRVTDGVLEMWFVLDMTAAGTAGTAVEVSIPIAATAAGTRVVGEGIIFDASVPQVYAGTWSLTTTSAIGFNSSSGTNNLWGATPSIALASGDSLRGHIRYLVAVAG